MSTATTTTRPPKVSVGLPVYNGQNFLDDAIRAIADQTFRDLEIVISDNASTDRTREICEAWMTRDPRIRYVRQEVNRGPMENFNGVFRHAQGEYFQWFCHDDMMDRTIIEKCVKLLDEDPTAVLAHALTRIVDAKGATKEDFPPTPHEEAHEPHLRFRGQLQNLRVYEIFGLMRSSALRKTALHRGFGHDDGVLLAHLSLLGRFRRIDEPLMFNREHETKSWNFYATYRDYTVWWNPATKGKILFPRWRMLREYVRAIGLADLDPAERRRCYREMLPWIRHYAVSLAANVVIAAGLWLKKILLWPASWFRPSKTSS